jgi:hypothetical protein
MGFASLRLGARINVFKHVGAVVLLWLAVGVVKTEQQQYSRKGAKAPRMTENEIGSMVVDSAIGVHRALGPGLLESVYEVVLAHELQKLGLEEKLPLRLGASINGF